MYNADFVVTATFESSWQAHEGCPVRFCHQNNEYGQCDVHDEWWVLPSADEILDL